MKSSQLSPTAELFIMFLVAPVMWVLVFLSVEWFFRAVLHVPNDFMRVTTSVGFVAIVNGIYHKLKD